MNGDRQAARDGYVIFLGQRFHSTVALTYVGLGAIVGSSIGSTSPGSQFWAALLGLLCFFGGLLWWIVLWRRPGIS